MKKQLIVAGVVAATSIAGLTGVQVANAVTNSSDSDTDPMSSLVNALATKFKLNKADVQKVVDEQHAKMQAEREQRVKDQVAALVTDGKLTQAQADKINTRRAELDKEREANRTADQNLTAEQRQAKRQEMRTKMEAKKTELTTWLKDNGIDERYAYLLMGGRGGHGGHGGMHRGDRDGDDAATKTTDTSSTSQ
jgi:hypothetical protein